MKISKFDNSKRKVDFTNIRILYNRNLSLTLGMDPIEMSRKWQLNSFKSVEV